MTQILRWRARSTFPNHNTTSSISIASNPQHSQHYFVSRVSNMTSKASMSRVHEVMRSFSHNSLFYNQGIRSKAKPATILSRNNSQPVMTKSLYSSIASSSQRTIVTITQTSALDIQSNKPETQILPSTPEKAVSTPPLIHNNTVVVTDSAVRQIFHLASAKRPDRPETVFLRIFVDSGGCSGFQYKFEMDFDDGGGGIDPQQDIVISATTQSTNAGDPKRVRVVIDSASLEIIQGSILDYTREMIKSSFVVLNNPQSEQACGCGSSFAVKAFKSNPAID